MIPEAVPPVTTHAFVLRVAVTRAWLNAFRNFGLRANGVAEPVMLKITEGTERRHE